MNAKLHILRAALCVAGCASWALTAAAETLRTINAAAGETEVVSDVIEGSGDVLVNTGTDSTGTVKLSGANTYTGTTTLGGGTLDASVLAPAETASSLGKSGKFAFKGGTFRYTGETAATFDRAVTFGSAVCTVENDADLTLSGKWTRTDKNVTFVKGGSGTLFVTGSGNTFGTNCVNEGMFELAGGNSVVYRRFFVNGQVGEGETKKSTLKITGGTHSLSYAYIGQYDGINQSDEYWADFIMTGGSVTASQISLGYKGKAHVTMDVSGGTLTDSGVMNISNGGSDNYDSYVDVTIRDSAVVSASAFYPRCKKTHATLTVKDGGTFKVGSIYHYSSGSSYAYTVLFDGGNVIWAGSYTNVFKGAKNLLYSPVLIGTKGASFSGVSSLSPYEYNVAMKAEETEIGGTAKGVSFATGTFSLMKANSYAGPTKVCSDATVVAGIKGAIPSASVVTVENGGALAVTATDAQCGALVLDGDLEVVKESNLVLGTGDISGNGCITLYDDAERTVLTATPETYKILSVPVDYKEALEDFAAGAKNNNGGSLEVTSDENKAYLKLTITSESRAQPDCQIEGANDASAVTFNCFGTVVRKDGVKYLKPGVEATLSVIAPDNLYFLGWRDTTTDEFISTEKTVTITPTDYTTYSAVFGTAWTYSSDKISNGIWTFAAAVSGSEISVRLLESETTVDGVLNFTTPVTNASGKSYTITQLGTADSTSAAPFYKATYAQRMALKRLYLPSTLTMIGKNAFYNCSNLTGRVTTPASCVRIGPNAFQSCTSLTSLDLSGVTTIDTYAFYCCTGLTSVRLSENLTSLGTYAFSKASNLVSVTPFLPDGITILGREVFSECTKLAGDLKIRNVKDIGYECFNGDKALASTIVMSSITNIGYSAFKNVAATNYVFGMSRVNFMDFHHLPGTAYHRGNGQSTFYTDATTTRHFRFPGQAPILDKTVTVAGSYAACSNQVFGTANQNGKVIIHGSWERDPEGWGKILEDVGSAETPEGETPPTPQGRDVEVKGIFRWRNASVSGTKYSWGWLMDTKTPGLIMLLR